MKTTAARKQSTALIELPHAETVPVGWWEQTVKPWADRNPTADDLLEGVAFLDGVHDQWEKLGRDTIEFLKARRYLEVRWGELVGPHPGRGRRKIARDRLSKDERLAFRRLAAGKPAVLAALRDATDESELGRALLLRQAQGYLRAQRASRPKEPLTLRRTRGETRPAERAYSIADWEALDATARREIIAAGFDCRTKLNEQPSDAIEWARRSLNTVTGCLHDCPYCYARDIAQRSKAYPQGFAPTFHPSRLGAPANDVVPPEAKSDPAYRNIFANSMSDLFGQWVPVEWIEATIEMARRNPQWTFLVLTKFPQRAADFEFPKNWWMGTTVDAQARVANAERAFAKISCGTKWLSIEPLLQPLTFTRLDLFQWLVIGGASPSSKTPSWLPPVRAWAPLLAAADAAGIAVYFKTNCGLADGVRIREFPWTRRTSTPRPPSPFRYLKGL
jgi:protein gp37